MIAPVYSPLWKKLYSSIKKFVEIEPWNYFENEDIFFLHSPKSHNMYLCSIMGNGGEEFGLNAFRNEQGIRNFYKMLSIGKHGDSRSLAYELDMLSFSLGNKTDLEERDLSVTKKLLLSFKGGDWPLLRSYSKLYYPRFLTEEEIFDLTVCIDQSIELANDAEDTIDMIRSSKPGEALVRFVDDGGKWQSKHVTISYKENEDIPEITPDDITLKTLFDLPASLNEEIDLVPFSAIVKKDDYPYYPLLCIGISKEKATQYGVYAPTEDYFKNACYEIAKSFITRGNKPESVFLDMHSPFSKVFQSFFEESGINLRLCDKLPNIEFFVKTIDEDGGLSSRNRKH